MENSELKNRLDFAVHAARLAGRSTLHYFRRDDLAVELKADDSPVTIADRQAEQSLRKQIGEQFSRDAILGEEFDDKPGSTGFRWILDPIDGTQIVRTRCAALQHVGGRRTRRRKYPGRDLPAGSGPVCLCRRRDGCLAGFGRLDANAGQGFATKNAG